MKLIDNGLEDPMYGDTRQKKSIRGFDPHSVRQPNLKGVEVH